MAIKNRQQPIPQDRVEILRVPDQPPTRERRFSPRFKNACPVVLHNCRAQELARSRTTDISNCGCRMMVRPGASLAVGRKLDLELKIPRHTQNTYMLESLSTNATVVRAQELPADPAGEFDIALQFAAPLELQLE